jgi:ATP-dependent Clp protease ATP-binding subunit ClpA
MFERLTVPAREVVMRARDEAKQLHHPMIGTEHLLLALLDDRAGAAYRVLHAAGITHDRVRADVERLVGAPAKLLGDEDAAALRTVGIDLDAVLARIKESFGPEALDALRPRESRGPLRFSPRARKVVGLALREAIHLRQRAIGPEHVLLGLIREGEGLAAKVLTDAGVDLAGLRAATLATLREAA